MLDYNILALKPTIKLKSDYENSTEVECKDLLAKTYTNYSTGNYRMLIVNKHYVARPDLVSLALYGDDRYADIICKINGISNPFELNEDDMIMVPEVENIHELYTSNLPSTLVDENEETDIINIDKTYQKKKTDRRSPGRQLIGDSNYIIDKSSNLVFY